MQILVNSNHSVDVSRQLEDQVKATVEGELERFDDQLTRVEVHLNDENSGKSGPQDKRCQMEARVKGHEPISASHKADSLSLAIDGAAEKLSHALAHALDKKQNHH
nr:ribosome-associated translation inhibitor RaiA [Pseudomonas sp.]